MYRLYILYIHKACYLVCFNAIYSYVKEHSECYFEIMKMRDRMLQFKTLGGERQSFTIMIKRCGIRLVSLVLCDEETYWLTKYILSLLYSIIKQLLWSALKIKM